jgi:enediyne biosynthesis protein E4
VRSAVTQKLSTPLCCFLTCLAGLSVSRAADSPFSFRDVTKEVGLLLPLTGMNGHGAGWGDLNGDGFPELYVGGFDKSGEHPNVLFLNSQGKSFSPVSAKPTRVSGRANSILFVDFDNDGDLDVYLSNLGGGKSGYAETGSRLFRNDGGPEMLTDISAESGACPPGFRGRGATAFDYDGDGLLDLLIGEAVHYGSPRRSRILRNRGKLKFEDVSGKVGLPAGLTGLGTAAADVNNDGWPDIFLAGRNGGNRLFLNDGNGQFEEHPQSPKLFEWQFQDGDDTPCGVCFADVNLDGWPDLLIGQHYDRPWQSPVPIRLYLNRGGLLKTGTEEISKRVPQFEEVTAAAGLTPLFLKAPHVEVQDFDNDGLPDISTSIVRFAGEKVVPTIFRGIGVGQDGVPRFELTGRDTNNFPTKADREIRRSGEFFTKVLAERKIMYTAPAPTADFDRDGRLDIFLANWFAESPSMLLRNETEKKSWLQVKLTGRAPLNRMAIGCKAKLYEAGKAGEASSLIGSREISVGFGYASGHEAVAHFGLGTRKSCDLVIEFPHGLGQVTHRNVKSNQRFETNLAARRERLRP